MGFGQFARGGSKKKTGRNSKSDKSPLFYRTYLGRPGFSSSSGMDSKQLVQFHAFVSSYDKSCFYNSPEDEAKALMDDLVFWTSEQPLDDDDISFMEDEMSVVLNLVEKGVASNLGLMWYWG